ERLRIPALRRRAESVERGLEIVVFEEPARDRGHLRGAFDVVADLAGNGGVASSVPIGNIGHRARRLELLAREVRDRLEHPQTALRLYDERRVDERLQLIECSLTGDRLGIDERAPAREDGETPERILRGRVEEGVAPVDRRAERLLAFVAV